MRAYHIVRLAVVLAGAWAASAAAEEVTYTPSDVDFANPERGFFVTDSYDPARGWTAPLDLDRLLEARQRGISMVRMYYNLAPYRNKPLGKTVLQRIARDFSTARRAGVKLIPRFAYNAGPIGARDASRTRILAHLDQLRPILGTNADAIAFLEAGFIGAWGEWHSSTNGLDTDAGRRAILNKLLAVLPKQRMAVVRTPRYKWRIYANQAPLAPEEAWSASNRARTGAHNDCFLASVDDEGTYSSTAPAVVDAEKNFLSLDNRFVPQGGETCSADSQAQPFTSCANALADFARLRWSTINEEYHPGVIAGWEAGGCLGEIRRRLGYRFVLAKAEIPSVVSPGSPLSVRMTVQNAGWAAPYNPRPVELVLRNSGTGELAALATGVDARSWQPGEDRLVELTATVPPTLMPGTYQVLLKLPDPAPALRSRPEYAIRLANEGMWDPVTGLNDLGAAVTVP